MVYLNENEFTKSLHKYKYYTNEEISNLGNIYSSFYSLSLSLNGLTGLSDINDSLKRKIDSVIKLHNNNFVYLNGILSEHKEAESEVKVIMENINTGGAFDDAK